MRPQEAIEQQIARLEDRTSIAFDERTLKDVFLTMDQSIQTKPGRPWRDFGRVIMRSPITQLAVAAAIIAVMLLLARHLVGTQTPNNQSESPQITDQRPLPTSNDGERQLAKELALAEQRFSEKDVAGLMDLLETGQDQTQVKVAGYLAELDAPQAVPALQRLASAWTSDPNANPFVQAIARIKPASLEPNNPPVEQAPAKAPAPPVGQVLKIKVVDKATDESTPSATIRTRIGGKQQEYTTDHEGILQLDIGPSVPDSMIVSAMKEGYVQQSVIYRGLGREAFPKAVKFALEKGAVIGGVIHDEAGQPVPDAEVEFYFSTPQQFLEPWVNVSFKGRADDQGWWRCADVPKVMDRLWINVRHPDYADGGIEIPGDASMESLYAVKAVAVLRKGISVAGRVLDTKGRPITGAKLLANEDYYGRDWTETDANGGFVFPHLRPINRTFLLTVQASRFAPQRRELPSEKGMEPVEFVLEPGKVLLGHVVDVHGSPIQGARVGTEEWNGWRTVKWESKTGQDGRFTWNSAPSDAIRIHIIKAGYKEWLREVIADDQEQTFVMYKPFHMKGSVFDGQTGEVVKRFKLTPGIQWKGDTTRAVWQTTDDWVKWFTEGRYEYTFNSDGLAYAVRIEADGYRPAESQFVDANQQEVSLDITLTKGQGPTGYVMDAQGRPVGGVEVLGGESMLIQNGRVMNKEQQIGTKTDEQGRFSFKSLDHPTPLAALNDYGIGFVGQTAGNEEVVIVLQPWARVTGDLLVGTRPAVHKELKLGYINSFPGGCINLLENKVTTEENGRFLFERVYPSKFRLYNRLYESKPGQTIELHIGGTGRTIRGELTPPVQSELAASDLPIDSDLRLVSTDLSRPFDAIPRPDGLDAMSYDVEMDGRSFQVDDVGPGRYALCSKVRGGSLLYRSGLMPSKVVARIWYEFEVPAITDTNQLDIPLDLGRIPMHKGELEPGDPAPGLEVPTFGPNPIRLSDYQGRVVLLCFYRGPYEERTSPVLETLKALSRQYRDNPSFAMIGVFQSLQPQILDKKALDVRGLDWPHGFVEDENCKAFVEYGIDSVPYWNVLIGPDGTIQAIGIPMKGLVEAVTKALNGS